MNIEEIIEFTDINGKKIKGCGFGEPVKCQDITIKEFKPFPVEATDLDLDNEIADTIHYLARINVLGKEIERLNNVLIELVKWLHNEIKRLDKMQDTYDKHGKKKDPNIIYISGAYIEVLDKLQELTGDGSNE